jgi:hypothetical protein
VFIEGIESVGEKVEPDAIDWRFALSRTSMIDEDEERGAEQFDTGVI